MPRWSGCHTIWRSGSTASPRASVASASAIKSTHSPIGSRRSTSAFEITRTSTTISFRTAAPSARAREVLGGHETRSREASHEAIGQGERELLIALVHGRRKRRPEDDQGNSLMELIVGDRPLDLEVVLEV